MKKLNKKGFTLVELLAVIVVLALIMILTVPTVLDQMNSARQSSFLLYAGKMIEAAQAKYESQMLLGVPDDCFELSSLNDSASNQYKGKITVTVPANSGSPEFRIQMFDANFQLGLKAEAESVTNKVGDKAGGVTYSEIETIKANLKNGILQPAPKGEELTTANNTIKCS